MTGLTYFPQHPGSRMHPDAARFLATVGLPSNKLFSTKFDLHVHRRLECQPSLKAAFDADGGTLPMDASLSGALMLALSRPRTSFAQPWTERLDFTPGVALPSPTRLSPTSTGADESPTVRLARVRHHSRMPSSDHKRRVRMGNARTTPSPHTQGPGGCGPDSGRPTGCPTAGRWCSQRWPVSHRTVRY